MSRSQSTNAVIEIDFSSLTALATDMRASATSVRKASVFAVNEGARFGRASALRDMDEQITLGKKYMSDNMQVSKARITAGEVSATITGRQRPTSLSRFLVNKTLRTTFTSLKKGDPRPTLKVKVKKQGAGSGIPGAFLVRMRSGKELTETGYNVGMAIRLPNGKQVHNRKKELKPFAKGKNSSLYLLHGPSVDQLFRSIVSADKLDDTVADRVEREFMRQLERVGVI